MACTSVRNRFSFQQKQASRMYSVQQMKAGAARQPDARTQDTGPVFRVSPGPGPFPEPKKSRKNRTFPDSGQCINGFVRKGRGIHSLIPRNWQEPRPKKIPRRMEYLKKSTGNLPCYLRLISVCPQNRQYASWQAGDGLCGKKNAPSALYRGADGV